MTGRGANIGGPANPQAEWEWVGDGGLVVEVGALFMSLACLRCGGVGTRFAFFSVNN